MPSRLCLMMCMPSDQMLAALMATGGLYEEGLSFSDIS